MNQYYLIVISGPTASGKSDMAFQLAQHFRTSIISADSRQIYRDMDIGTAKPTLDERAQIKHYLIDILNPGEPYSAAKFEKDAEKHLREIFRKKSIAIMCGGTGFYIQALLEGLDDFPEIPQEFILELEQDLNKSGLEYLSRELKEKDPQRWKEINPENPRRVIRALSIVRYSAKPTDFFRRKKPKSLFFTPIKILITLDREELYNRINSRVDKMIETGLEKEARILYEKGLSKKVLTVGYSEWFDYFNGMADRNSIIELIKRNTRRYAKRQLTWFRGKDDWTPFQSSQIREVIHLIHKEIGN